VADHELWLFIDFGSTLTKVVASAQEATEHEEETDAQGPEGR
jgi:hypothetical protein